jgi:hypothetical protein
VGNISNYLGQWKLIAGRFEAQVASKEANDCLVLFEVFVIKQQFVETIVIRTNFYAEHFIK